MRPDIPLNRSTQKYKPTEQARRVLWSVGKIFFRLSPRICFGWRTFVLRCFGASIGNHVHLYPTAKVYYPWNLTIGDWSAIGEDALIYNLGPVTIGERATVSHRAHICAGTHDLSRPDFPLLKEPINIGDEAWICADAFVGPGVNIGTGAVVGARAVAVRDIDAWTIAAGNPAKSINRRKTEKAAPSEPDNLARARSL